MQLTDPEKSTLLVAIKHFRTHINAATPKSDPYANLMLLELLECGEKEIINCEPDNSKYIPNKYNYPSLNKNERNLMIDSTRIKILAHNIAGTSNDKLPITSNGSVGFPTDSDIIGELAYLPAFKTYSFYLKNQPDNTAKVSGISGTFTQVMGFIATLVIYGEVNNS